MAKITKKAYETALSSIKSIGFAFGQNAAKVDGLKAQLVLAVKNVSEENEKEGSNLFTLVYIAGKLNPDAPALTTEMEAKARAIVEKAHYAEDNAPTRDGRPRNTLAEKLLRDSARQAWSSFRKAEEIARADKRGGARQTKGKKEEKTPSKTTIKLVAKDAKDAAANVNQLKAGWLNMLNGLKQINLTAEELHECNNVTVALNRVELLLGKHKEAPAAK